MKNIYVSEYIWQGVENLNVEIVERKGLGHPDYIADGVAEAVSRGLCNYYLSHYNTILHHNVDKVLVVGGQANPRFGGGEVLHPIRIIVSGRATSYVKTEAGLEFIPIGTIVLKSVNEWIKSNFRYLDPQEHLIVDYKIGQGSVDLVKIFELGLKKIPLANDTSFGISYAPLSTLENVVLSTEHLLNSPEIKKRIPALGEDVKVMGLRIGKKIILTVAVAMISRWVRDRDEYLNIKEETKNLILDHVLKLAPDYDIEIHINVGDKPDQGVFYLTVTGTSAEHGDDGATGRGNRVNGLITPMRPMSLEATAGKNPVSHVGKLFNVAANIIADRIYKEVQGIKEVYVGLLSQIGKPINEPLVVDIKIVPEKPPLTSNIINECKAIASEVLDNIPRLTLDIIENKVNLF
ncbi:MAG: methionine adenosyltransferase [Desulfurococcaceae archaeon]|jgi:S-adenosylmethionine synthetase|nr:methionine adenosyltransferase [Desulfurococcaceae archaeon]